MKRPKPFLSPALAVALALSACAPAPALRPSLGLGAIAAQAGEAQGLLVLDFGAGYALQSLAHLASLRVTLKRQGAQDLVRNVDAAALNAGQGRVSFEALSVGPVVVEVEGLDAQGALLGFARGEVAIQAGQTARLPLRLSVGGPATQGGLGVDLAVNDDPASNLVRPLKLVAASGLPPASGSIGRVLKDLAGDRQDGGWYVALGESGLLKFSPDLSASNSTAVARAYSVAAMPQGGVLVSTDVPFIPNPVGTTAASPVAMVRLFPNGGTTQQRPSELDQLPEFGASIMAATPEGTPIFIEGQQRRVLSANLPPQPLPGATWALPTPYLSLSQLMSFAYSGRDALSFESGWQRGEVIVNDLHRAYLINDQGAGRSLWATEYEANGLPIHSQDALAQAQRDLPLGKLKGTLLAMTPDHRGAYWALTQIYLESGVDVLAVWRGRPDTAWTPVWGPQLLPDEEAKVQGLISHQPLMATGGTGLPGRSMGLTTIPGENRPCLASDAYFAAATSRPGRLAISNGAGLFVLEEQAASAP